MRTLNAGMVSAVLEGPPGVVLTVLAEITSEVRVARLRAARSVNFGLLDLYWRVGGLILLRQQREPWGRG